MVLVLVLVLVLVMVLVLVLVLVFLYWYWYWYLYYWQMVFDIDNVIALKLTFDILKFGVILLVTYIMIIIEYMQV